MVERQKFKRFLAIGAATFALAFGAVPAAYSQSHQASSPDAECLACHSQSTLTTGSGRSVYVNEAKHKASVHADLPCVACHSDISGFPHPKQVQKVECSACHAQEASAVPMSIHAALGAESCSSCHGSAHDTRPAASLAPQLCGSCHRSEWKDFLSSAHGQAVNRGDPQAPSCQTCHGSAHKVLAADDPMSPATRKNLPQTCGSCHANAGFLAKHQIPFAHPVESFETSVHGRALAAGNRNAPSCSDCHSAHAIYSAQDSRSTINHWHVPQTCAACHAGIAKTYAASIHGQAAAHGVTDAPVCTDCHGDHSILAPANPQSPVNPARVSLVTCGRCHGDALLATRYNLPADRVPTFADSFHGLASRAGSQTVANCASCHGVHNIFPSSDPRSTVNPANLAKTCGACHSGAGKDFAIGAVHVGLAADSENAVVKAIRWTYWLLIPAVIGFMLVHHGLDFLHKLRENRRFAASEQVPRMNLHFRIAHWLTVVSFPTLVVTGFALKYPEDWWARPLLRWEGRFAFRGTLHRVAAGLLLGSLAYHIAHLALVRRDRAFWRDMLPNLDDLRDLGAMFLYNLGLSEVRPAFGRFSYIEKIEYLAFLWGTLVMAATGFTLWFNDLALRYLPKWVSDAATALHFYEAVLATCAILIWHMYTVVFDPDVYPMDRAWLSGSASAEHLRHTRPAYYAELKKAEAAQAAHSPSALDVPESESPPSLDVPTATRRES